MVAHAHYPKMRRAGPPVVAMEHRYRFPFYVASSVLVTLRYWGSVPATAPAKAVWHAFAVVREKAVTVSLRLYEQPIFRTPRFLDPRWPSAVTGQLEPTVRFVGNLFTNPYRSCSIHIY